MQMRTGAIVPACGVLLAQICPVGDNSFQRLLQNRPIYILQLAERGPIWEN